MTVEADTRKSTALTGHAVAMTSALEMTYAALARKPDRAAPNPTDARGRRTRRSEKTAMEPHVLIRCPDCGVVERPEGKVQCCCKTVRHLITRFLEKLRNEFGFRIDYQGYIETGGISLGWDNSTAQRDVDDYEVLRGAFDLELRFSRSLSSIEVDQVERLVERQLYPAFLETRRELGSEGGTCFHIALDFRAGL